MTVSSTQSESQIRGIDDNSVAATLPLLTIALTVIVLHLATNFRYGFHRDELQFLSDASHLDWGFVAYPPLTPYIERISLALFGVSLEGLRLCSVLFQAAAIIVSGLMAKELGGHKLAQMATALSVALSPLPIFEGTEFQYSSFDYLWWVSSAYFLICLLKSENSKWWLAIGATLGLALNTKYSVVFFIAGILGGLILTRSRRYLLDRWFWIGVVVTVALFLPNFFWQVRHDFISYHFLQSIHARDVHIGRANSFLKDQVLVCVNLVAAPVALLGLIAYLRSPRYRLIAMMYLIPLALFYFAKGRGYYLAAAYPMLLAMGAVAAEQWLTDRSRAVRITTQSLYFAALSALGIYICCILIPLASSGPLRDFALSKNSDLREEFGWKELVKTVASIRDSLPAAQQQSLGIVVQNYGEAGAIEILGSDFNLPTPINNTNSGWLRGYPTPVPTTFIVLGMDKAHADRLFVGCRVAGHNGNSEGVSNEESENYPDIFVCGPTRRPLPDLWKEALNFG